MAFARVALGLILLAACNGDDGEGTGSECLMQLDAECEPAFEPTFDELYTRQIAPRCALGGGACHGSEEGQAGLSMMTADRAYDELLGLSGDRARVVPGNPECSVVMQRVESMDDDFVMPVKMRMSPGQRCAMQRWIANGAERQ
jgi:hypothetical protein